MGKDGMGKDLFVCPKKEIFLNYLFPGVLGLDHQSYSRDNN